MVSLKSYHPLDRIVEVIEQQFRKDQARNLLINCGFVDYGILILRAEQICATLNIRNYKLKDSKEIKILFCNENELFFIEIADVSENNYSAKWQWDAKEISIYKRDELSTYDKVFFVNTFVTALGDTYKSLSDIIKREWEKKGKPRKVVINLAGYNFLKSVVEGILEVINSDNDFPKIEMTIITKEYRKENDEFDHYEIVVIYYSNKINKFTAETSTFYLSIEEIDRWVKPVVEPTPVLLEIF